LRVGLGYDIHRLVEGDGVVLGGEKIPLNRRLMGHSDGDVLSHAIIDALLGAAQLGDIGQHFPDTDPAYKGICSLELLKKAASFLSSAGFRITNIDAVVVAETPRIAPHKEKMKANIAKALNIDVSQINVKGKTAEGIGPVGEGGAICVHAVALIEKENE
jgi:2-C-methyl-D-erythritol 2,4-cyclodiphosphate synthase